MVDCVNPPALRPLKRSLSEWAWGEPAELLRCGGYVQHDGGVRTGRQRRRLMCNCADQPQTRGYRSCWCTVRSAEEELLDAVKDARPQIVQKLVRQGVDVNAKRRTTFTIKPADAIDVVTASHNSSSSSGADSDDSDSDDDDDVQHVDDALTPLLSAAMHCDLDIAALLLAAGADPNATDSYGRTTLHHAAARGDVALLNLLCAHGARVDAVNKAGNTPLLAAAANADAGVVAALLQHGADVNRVNGLDLVSALAAARQGGLAKAIGNHDGLAVTMFLVDEGVDPGNYAVHRATPLLRAAEHGHVDVARVLLAHGADAAARNAGGLSAGDLATRFRHRQLAAMLEAASPQ